MSTPGTYELGVQIDDAGPIARGEHFAELIRRGEYTVQLSSTSRPEAVTYKQMCCLEGKNNPK